MSDKTIPEGATHWSKLNCMYYKSGDVIEVFDGEWNVSRVTDLNTEYFEVV